VCTAVPVSLSRFLSLSRRSAEHRCVLRHNLVLTLCLVFRLFLYVCSARAGEVLFLFSAAVHSAIAALIRLFESAVADDAIPVGEHVFWSGESLSISSCAAACVRVSEHDPCPPNSALHSTGGAEDEAPAG
jgi:hypothetical protein